MVGVLLCFETPDFSISGVETALTVTSHTTVNSEMKG